MSPPFTLSTAFEILYDDMLHKLYKSFEMIYPNTHWGSFLTQWSNECESLEECAYRFNNNYSAILQKAWTETEYRAAVMLDRFINKDEINSYEYEEETSILLHLIKSNHHNSDWSKIYTNKSLPWWLSFCVIDTTGLKVLPFLSSSVLSYSDLVDMLLVFNPDTWKRMNQKLKRECACAVMNEFIVPYWSDLKYVTESTPVQRCIQYISDICYMAM